MTDEEFMQLAQAAQQEMPPAEAPPQGMTPQQFAQEAGPIGAAARSYMSSATAGLSQPVLDALSSLLGDETGLTAAEKLKAGEEEYFLPSTLGSLAGYITPFGAASGVTRLITKGLTSAPKAAQAAGRVAGDVGLGALEALLSDKDVGGAAAGGALGGAAGEVIGPAVRAVGGKMAARRASELMNNPKYRKVYDEVDKLLGKKLDIEAKIPAKEGEAAAKTFRAKQSDIAKARQAEKELARAQKDVAKVQEDIAKGKFQQGTPEAQQLQETKREFDNLQRLLQQRESALNTLIRQAEVAGGKATESGRKAIQSEIDKIGARLEDLDVKEQLTGVLRRLVTESDEAFKARAKQATKARQSEEALAEFQARQAQQAPGQVAEQAAEAARPSLSEFRYSRQASDVERELLEDAIATGKSWRDLEEVVGVPRATLYRRAKERYGITPESAREAVEKRAAERAAAQEARAAAAPPPEAPPELVPRPSKPGLFEEFPYGEGDIRKVMTEEAGIPVQRQSLEAQQAAAQAKMAQQPSVFDIEAGPYSQALRTARGGVDELRGRVEAAQEAVDQAKQTLASRPSPEAQQALDVAQGGLETAQRNFDEVMLMMQQGGREAIEAEAGRLGMAPLKQALEQTNRQYLQRLDDLERLGVNLGGNRGLLEAMLTSGNDAAATEARAIIGRLGSAIGMQPEEEG